MIGTTPPHLTCQGHRFSPKDAFGDTEDVDHGDRIPQWVIEGYSSKSAWNKARLGGNGYSNSRSSSGGGTIQRGGGRRHFSSHLGLGDTR